MAGQPKGHCVRCSGSRSEWPSPISIYRLDVHKVDLMNDVGTVSSICLYTLYKTSTKHAFQRLCLRHLHC